MKRPIHRYTHALLYTGASGANALDTYLPEHVPDVRYRRIVALPERVADTCAGRRVVNKHEHDREYRVNVSHEHPPDSKVSDPAALDSRCAPAGEHESPPGTNRGVPPLAHVYGPATDPFGPIDATGIPRHDAVRPAV